ncbi:MULTISPECIES: YezD family protein [Aneurinibacillus]|uniref:DUF2292 domain-containing protein n=1 Tax=Aneurinibacillus danicus TaxID=267746 RepID=A0A511V3L7_9BACL|nr:MULTISPECIES: YezD family protein [Aneurinibacillus]GEN33510.1 hypothetical protein ADA01nite_09700 [Aneurinibacillus danicus]
MSAEKEERNQTIDYILDALQGLQYGSIQITIHDSKITQIDRLEKQRFPFQRSSSSTTDVSRFSSKRK